MNESAVIRPPWTAEQVLALNRWQASNDVHPFTCGNKNADVEHKNDGVLVATEHGWVCQDCGYTQDWAHVFMLNEERYRISLNRIEELMGKFPKADSAEGQEMERLVNAVSAYEDVAYPIDDPTPEGLQQFRKEQEGEPGGE